MGSELPFVASDDWFGGFTPWDTYGIDLPPGKWELEVEVTGGVTLTCGGRCSVHPSLRHLLGHFIGPGGADPGPNPIFTNEDRFFPVSLVKYATVRGRPVHRPIWSAPPDNLSSAQTKIRVDGNARYYFSRDWNSQPVFTFWMAGVTVTANQYARITARRVDAELRLSCTGDLGQNRVTRGQSIRCDASADNGQVEIESWSFTGTDSNAEDYTFPTDFDGPIVTNPWIGKMAVGGIVSVRAKVNGGDPQEKTAPIVVEPRRWEGEPVQSRVAKVSWGEFPSRELPPPYPTSVRHLGRIAFRAEHLPPSGEVVEEILDFGPNHYLVFYKRVPLQLEMKVLVHPEMETRGDFWRRQATERPAYGTPCLRSRFASYVAVILAHEGVPPNPESHSGVFIREMEKSAGPVIEDLVVQNTELRSLADEAADRLSPVLERAVISADEPVDVQHPVPFGCEFNFEQRG